MNKQMNQVKLLYQDKHDPRDVLLLEIIINLIVMNVNNNIIDTAGQWSTSEAIMISIQHCKTRLLKEIQTLQVWTNCTVINLKISKRPIRTPHTLQKQVIKAEMQSMISAAAILSQYQLKVIIFQVNNFREQHHKLTLMKLSKVSDENSALNTHLSCLRIYSLSHLIRSIL